MADRRKRPASDGARYELLNALMEGLKTEPFDLEEVAAEYGASATNAGLGPGKARATAE